MSAEPNRVRDLFHAVVEIPASGRSAYLAEACGPDADLRAGVEQLLAADTEPENVLDRIAHAMRRPRAATCRSSTLNGTSWARRSRAAVWERVRRHRHRSGPRSGRQSTPDAIRHSVPAVCGRGPDHRSTPASGHSPGSRAGLAHRWPAVPGDEAYPGSHAGRTAEGTPRSVARPPAVPGGVRASLSGRGLRARSKGDPPRFEARQRDGRQLRRSPGHGLGTGQGAGKPTERGGNGVRSVRAGQRA